MSDPRRAKAASSWGSAPATQPPSTAAESAGRRLTAFTIGADGSLSDRRIFADGLDGPPDGIALDAEGGVWTSMTLANQFERIVEGGTVTERLDHGKAHAS